MKKYISLSVIFILCFYFVKGQHLFPEKFNDCALSTFCLDCGDVKGAYSNDLQAFFAEKFETKNIKNIEGVVFVQVLIDTSGKQCVMSIGDKASGKTSRLDLRNIINTMTGWKPAIAAGRPESVSITLKFLFNRGEFRVSYDRFEPEKITNMKSVGDAEIVKRSANSKTLKNDFKVYTTGNSVIPWDMTRAVSVDSNNITWLGTDNGIVKIENNNFSVINSKNSALKARKEETIMASAIDAFNNKWFSDGYRVYRTDGKKWDVFDSTNSPINWTTEIYADKYGNVWFPGWHGLIKYDGNTWTTMDTSNSAIPSNRVYGAFVDSKKRLWIGTDKGNIRIDGAGSVIEDFKTTENPLRTAALSKAYEDRNGNIWMALYEKFPQTKGFAKYSPAGEWTVISTENSKIPRNDILDFEINEETNTIWFSINRVGIAQFDGKNWATFTPENSKVPSTYIQDISLDKNGNLWCATFAGLLKITPR